MIKTARAREERAKIMLRIGILPLDGAGELEVSETRRVVEERFYAETRVLPEKRIPLSLFDNYRRQFLADAVLELVAEHAENLDALVSVAGVDAYTPGLNFVFGIASSLLRACVVFTWRLKPEFYGEPPSMELYVSRLRKEVVHELGHVFGLKHCRTPGCVMRFSNSIRDTDAKSDKYCLKCTRKLLERGIPVRTF